MQNTKIKKNSRVVYTPPDAPFEELDMPNIDKSWRSSADGSTISYLSDCNDLTDPSLQSLFTGVTSMIENVSIIESAEIKFNDRAALHTTLDGTVDGVTTRFELLLFKKNNCNYILTYAAVTSEFGKNQKAFQKFSKGFYAP